MLVLVKSLSLEAISGLETLKRTREQKTVTAAAVGTPRRHERRIWMNYGGVRLDSKADNTTSP